MLDKFEAEYTYTAREKGQLLSHKALTEGRFEDAHATEKMTLLTTMLTEVPTALWDKCLELDSAAKRKVTQPNGFFSSRLVVVYAGKDFSLEIERKIKNPFYLIIPGLTEVPSSYKVTISLNSTNKATFDFLNTWLQEQA